MCVLGGFPAWQQGIALFVSLQLDIFKRLLVLRFDFIIAVVRGLAYEKKSRRISLKKRNKNVTEALGDPSSKVLNERVFFQVFIPTLEGSRPKPVIDVMTRRYTVSSVGRRRGLIRTL
jgi:hypothetical protein